MADLERIPCPLCGNGERFIDIAVPGGDLNLSGYGAIYAGRTRSEWKICGRCGFVHQNPRPSTAALNRYYLEGRYHDPIRYTAQQVWDDQAPAYVDEIDFALKLSRLETGAVFDIGCGLGVALKLFEQRGWRCYGVEPDAARCDYARREFGLAGIKNTILDENIQIDEPVDLVFSHHAFEHFADLDQVMAGVRRILKPGGFIFTAIPTYRNNRTTMSKRWMNSAHYNLFTHRSFAQLLARYGFREVAHEYDGWSASDDQLGFLAQRSDDAPAAETFFEDPDEVSRYLAWVNPARSVVHYPFSGALRRRIDRNVTLALRMSRLLVTSPNDFVGKVRGWLQGHR